MSKIISIKRVKNERLQAEMTDVIEKPGKLNVLQRLNKGDEAFTVNERRTWFPVTIASLIDLGVSASLVTAIEALKLNEKVDCLIENPTVSGEVLRIQVTETTQGNEYQTKNFLKAAKQLEISQSVIENTILHKHPEIGKHVGENGYFMTDEGHFIFSNTIVTVESQVRHSFIDGILVPSKIAEKVGSTLNSVPVKVGEQKVTF